MTLCWNSRIIANSALARIHGFRVAGGFGLRLGFDFTVPGWDEGELGPMPAVFFYPAEVLVGTSSPFALGRAFFENPNPFTVTKHGSGPTGVLLDFVLSPSAMEHLERTRFGSGMHFKVRLQAEARKPSETRVIADEVSKSFNQSEWLSALEQAGYGRTMLFEVPIPEGAVGDEHWTRMLERARVEFLEGRYPAAVGACRQVLESLNSTLNQEGALKVARDQHKKDRTELSVGQRELILRQAAMDYSSPSHHMDSGHPDDLYDRRAAQMLLGIVSSLVTSALARASDVQRAISSPHGAA